VPATSINQSRSIARKIVAIDRRFEAVIKAAGPCTIGQTPSKSTNFQALADSILSQQLSIKAADTIIKRVKVLAGGSITAEKIARLSDDALRSAGCSSAKSRALRELASATVNREIPMRTLHTLTDEEIFTTLVPLFGIGQWTVEMFLIFQLGRVDIWPVGDLGVRRGWEKIHRLSEEITPKELKKKGERFAPFRSHVAWYCWRALSS
jgi:DNA-3-methyladenine glycosylase II